MRPVPAALRASPRARGRATGARGRGTPPAPVRSRGPGCTAALGSLGARRLRPCPVLPVGARPGPMFFFNDTATTEIYTLSLHDALPISQVLGAPDLQQQLAV